MSFDTRDEADRLLDAAIAGYTVCEPRAGMEQRVLKRIAPADPWPKWLLCLAGASALALVYTFVPGAAGPDRTPFAGETIASIPVAIPDRHRPLNWPLRAVRVAAPRARRRPLPKRETFPSPSPLSNQEQVLLSLIELVPDRVAEILTEAQPREIAPLGIEAIAIQPLQSGELD